MSWFKAAGSYASGAIKAAATAVAPPSQRSAREQLKDHVTYLRSFAEATQQDKGADWDKLALTYRVPEELDSMLQLLEAENPNANAMREDPCKGPCTMFFLEECVMDMLYTLMGLEYSVNLQKWVIKAVIRVLRLRYELLDTGSIARLVLQMAERLEYSAKRLHFAIVHCEFLFTLCDKVQRNPWSLLPVMVSEGVNQGGLGATSGQELLLLNWTVQHIQDTAGGEYAQRGVLLLLRISDERVTTAACHHSSLIERTVRMVDSGFQSGMREMDQTDALDEVGSVRRRPDTSQFYSAMRFVDHILRVAHPSISRQLLDKLDSQFMRQTLSHRLLKGSEVQHVAVMETLRGLFEPDSVSLSQGTYSRRLQQPTLVSMVLRFLVGLPPTEGESFEAEAARNSSWNGGLLGVLIERIDSMNEDESVAVLQLFECVIEMHDKQAHHTLVSEPLSKVAFAPSLAEAASQGGGADSFDLFLARVAAAENLIYLHPDLQPPKSSEHASPTEGEGPPTRSHQTQADIDAYKRDAMRNVSTCFRCCDLWNSDGQVENCSDAASPSFVEVLLRRLAMMLTNTFQVNVLLCGIVTRLIGFPNLQEHTYLLDARFSDSLAPEIPTLLRIVEKLCKEAESRMSKLPKAGARLEAVRDKLGTARGVKEFMQIDDVDEQKIVRLLQGVAVLQDFIQELRATVAAKRQCCVAWNLLGIGR